MLLVLVRIGDQQRDTSRTLKALYDKLQQTFQKGKDPETSSVEREKSRRAMGAWADPKSPRTALRRTKREGEC